MEKIQFAVSAKTARLIGRENISDVEGAVIELIKNAYDADATCVYVQFRVPFPSVPKYISYELAHSVFKQSELPELLRYYYNDGTKYSRIDSLSSEEEKSLNSFLFGFNTIIVLDNGCGMSKSILRSAWMNIGTSEKEERKQSPGGRIKTGAKGIGRFALDKLSTSTTVYTKSSTDPLMKWKIDWNQFETAVMLDEVSAEIEIVDDGFPDLVKKTTFNRVKNFAEYSWDTGTIILLSPTREKWSVGSFDKLNKNLKSLFPETNLSQFDIYVDNVFSPSLSFENERFTLKESEYDYKIVGKYDGKDSLTVEISRNEIDTRKLKVILRSGEITHEYALKDFWAREAFQEDGYRRADYAKKHTLSVSAASVTEKDTAVLKTVGPFQAEFYFLKNTNSIIEIAKPILANKRKEIISNYSGIKLYRDGFKVRPYGEPGPAFDWLDLSERARKNPGAVSNNAAWRVRTNQLIGSVRISKEHNPNLVDMANREGLAINDTYYAFISIIEKIIETFEGDRQRVFREYAAWKESKLNEMSKTPGLVEGLKEKGADSYPSENKGNKNGVNGENTDEEGYSKHDYENAVLELDNERQQKERALKTMMLYSAAGVMTSTFSHEINRIMSNAGSRMQQLRHTITRLVGPEGYKGNPIFDPFPIINQSEKVDMLLESWLEVIMNAADQSAFPVKQVNFYQAIKEIADSWAPLLRQKLISIEPIRLVGEKDNCVCNMSIVDLHVIINNFMLNSAWFLERASVDERKIQISIEEYSNKIVLVLENNGPPLDRKFENNPERIFNPGETSKTTENGEGTGLGLWITKMVVEDASGEIHPLKKTNGFGLKLSFPK